MGLDLLAASSRGGPGLVLLVMVAVGVFLFLIRKL
jgi:hypothetical protein